jgi:hypothetical protein
LAKRVHSGWAQWAPDRAASDRPLDELGLTRRRLVIG